MQDSNTRPECIKVRGARVHNLKNIDVDIPLYKTVAIAGLSGSGKSSLALGVLYSEGSRRYLESLSAYTRRRMTQETKTAVESIENIPSAIALHQRPAIAGVRSTFGTATELLNTLRLMFSRLGSHKCPNGHFIGPSVNVAQEKKLICPICGAELDPPSAQSFSFNSDGACRCCSGTGVVRTVDLTTLVPDESLTIDEGAVAPWNSLMWSLMTDVCRAMGVRTDVPFKDLSQKERDIVFFGPAEKKHILYRPKSSDTATELDFTFYNAVYTVENALSKVKDDNGMKRIEKFLKQDVCPQCKGTRLCQKARSSILNGLTLPEACALSLDESINYIKGIKDTMPKMLYEMAQNLEEDYLKKAKPLIDLGLSYLSLYRESASLSTGERQRVQLSRILANNTTGVLYVLDEPSIGLHPSNVDGLLEVISDLKTRGNSIVLVDYDTRVLKRSDYLIEMGKGAGVYGGNVIAKGSVAEVAKDSNSLIAPFLDESINTVIRDNKNKDTIFEHGAIKLSIDKIHTLKPLTVKIPKGKLTAISGVSGSGKTTLILESLVPALNASIHGTKMPGHVKDLKVYGISRVNVIDASPIGANIRSTVATYSGILDDLRSLFAKTYDSKTKKLKASDFSYNTGKLRCPTCDGTGQITMDIQFLPDVEIICPTCKGLRYCKEAFDIRLPLISQSADKSKATQEPYDKSQSKPQNKSQSQDQAQTKDNSQKQSLTQCQDTHKVKWQDKSRLNAQENKESQDRGNSLAQENKKSQKDSSVKSQNQIDENSNQGISLPELMGLSISEALPLFAGHKKIRDKLALLDSLGLSYLSLGESTPTLSGGEAQRLKIAFEMDKLQNDAIFIFDEPSIGLHPLDIKVLINIFDKLIANGATIVVIEHDLDMLANADYIIDMGPLGGDKGGEIVATGSPYEIAKDTKSLTAKYLKDILKAKP